MSRWGFYESRPEPAPEHGIKMKKAGTTWWGQRWIEALVAVLEGDAGRLSRGRTYARAGRTHDLVIAGGRVTAKVTGSRPKPYGIEIVVTQLSDATWASAIEGMSAEARFAAQLLAGEMPQDIASVFASAGASLFPASPNDLSTDCSCPDWGDPCKHVAAAHYVLGEALDRDPFLLFELRGRSKDQVLAALRAARGAGREPARETIAIPTVSLRGIDPSSYDRLPSALPSLRLAFDAPLTAGSAAVLQQLGAPATWSGGVSPADMLAPLMRAAAESARRLALTEPESDAPAASAPRAKKPSRPSKKR